MTLPYIEKKGDSGFTTVIDTETITVRGDHPEYDALMEAVQEDDPEMFMNLYSKGNRLEYAFDETDVDIDVDEEKIFYKGDEVTHVVAEKILKGVKASEDVDSFILFLDHLMENPSKKSVDQLYDFLQSEGMPVTEDGCFLGYKAVRDDFTDKHTGEIDNSPGSVCEMRRNQVEDDPKVGCAPGLHVGSLKYAKNFRGGGRIVLVKVNPEDVVSVPEENHNKMRVCRYEVVDTYSKDEPLDDGLYR